MTTLDLMEIDLKKLCDEPDRLFTYGFIYKNKKYYLYKNMNSSCRKREGIYSCLIEDLATGYFEERLFLENKI